jgi:hypothetical protein
MVQHPHSPPPAPAPSPIGPAAPAPAPSALSKGAVAGGFGGAGIAIYVIDRLLADDGQVAATMLTKLSPLLGPVWASWPVLVILSLVAWIAFDKWRAYDITRRGEAAQQRADALAQQQATTALGGQMHDVVQNVAGLRGEVHSLTGRLHAHTEATEVRLGNVAAEVAGVRARVDSLERPAAVKPRKPRAVAAAAKSSARPQR